MDANTSLIRACISHVIGGMVWIHVKSRGGFGAHVRGECYETGSCRQSFFGVA